MSSIKISNHKKSILDITFENFKFSHKKCINFLLCLKISLNFTLSSSNLAV